MKIQDKMETIMDGKTYHIPKWKYLLNWWSPIFGIATILVVGAIFLGSFSERIFDTSEQKYDVINHSKSNELHLNQTERDKLVTTKEFDTFRQNIIEKLDDIKQAQKEMNEYLRRIKR